MKTKKPSPETQENAKKSPAPLSASLKKSNTEKEIGGFKDSGLPEPTRFGDWEVKGRCSDF